MYLHCMRTKSSLQVIVVEGTNVSAAFSQLHIISIGDKVFRSVSLFVPYVLCSYGKMVPHSLPLPGHIQSTDKSISTRNFFYAWDKVIQIRLEGCYFFIPQYLMSKICEAVYHDCYMWGQILQRRDWMTRKAGATHQCHSSTIPFPLTSPGTFLYFYSSRLPDKS